ncbi:MAG: DUF86 domain-containing protein [Phycisphaeraceae bacterium]|nr:DUF86 domain-containing protein [Phycisphaeraceae bacterium]
MLPEDKDAGFLWDIREASLDIIEFTSGRTFNEFESNKMVRFAVERQILVIGEAAKGISSALKVKTPGIPWGAIIAQRNILAHEYGEILVERVWRVAKDNIPELLKQIEPFIPDMPE